MTALRFVDHGVSCNHEGCATAIYASHLDLKDDATLATVRRMLRDRGWKTGVKNPDGPPLDLCPRHNPDLAIRVRAALDDGGWAEFSSQAAAGKVLLSAPGPEGSWRSLVTEQCADYLNGLGFRTQIADNYLHVSEG